MTSALPLPVAASGSFTLGDLTVHRLGYGTLPLTGPGGWGYPPDPDKCRRVLRRAVELGVTFIDTADSYGPYVSEELIREVLHPYPQGLVIATKAGLVRTGPNKFGVVGRPDYLRQECEMSLRRLGLERIDVFQLHIIDPLVPAEDQFGLLAELVVEGKVRHVGLSNVSLEEMVQARRIVPVVSVQLRYNLVDRRNEALLKYCESEGIGFIPWYPVGDGALADPGGLIGAISTETGATPAQIALAWLLRRSPAMLPIPGTTSIHHLNENCGAATVELSAAHLATLSSPQDANPEPARSHKVE